MSTFAKKKMQIVGVKVVSETLQELSQKSAKASSIITFQTASYINTSKQPSVTKMWHFIK